MSKPKDSEDLVRVGPGTAMGEMMRQYWLPAAMSTELECDGAPMRLMLLGEQLIAFRDSSGRVGVMDHRCPHRCASLFFGRNEEDGLRCVYHGWKYDVEGNCIDMANTPAKQDYKAKIKAKAYKVAERNGLVWVYMGDRRKRRHCRVSRRRCYPRANCRSPSRSANATGCRRSKAISTPRISAFCMPARLIRQIAGGQSDPLDGANRAPEYHVTDTDWGTMYAAYRPGEAGKTYWRFANFLFPFWTRRHEAPLTGSTAAPGSRWMTAIRCSSASRGKAYRRTARRSATAGCCPARN